MPKTVRVSVEFYCQGERFNLSSKVELDSLMERDDNPNFYTLLAEEHGIKSGTEAFGALQTAHIQYSEPGEEVRDYLVNGELDLNALFHHWRVEQELKALSDMAKHHLGVEDLAGHKEQLKQTLLHAYEKDEK